MMRMGFVLVSAILVDNFVLSKFLGCCPFLGVSKKMNSAVGMSVAVTFVMTLATAVTYPIYFGILVPSGLGYLKTLCFILVIAALVQLVELILKKFMPPLYRALGIYLPLITTNCAVLGVAILNVGGEYTFGEALVNSVGAGLGFMLALVLFAGVRERMEDSDIPEHFKGIPITLIAASIVSLAFMGFSGLARNLFGIM